MGNPHISKSLWKFVIVIVINDGARIANSHSLTSVVPSCFIMKYLHFLSGSREVVALGSLLLPHIVNMAC